MTDLDKLKAAVDEADDYLHIDDLAKLGISSDDRYGAEWLGRKDPIPAPPACVFCNAPWTPAMIELVELSGYCSSCSDAERVIDVFCGACTRLVYRKEVD